MLFLNILSVIGRILMYDDANMKGEQVGSNQMLILRVTDGSTHLDATTFLFNELLLSRTTVKDAEVTLDFLDDEYGRLLTIANDMADFIRCHYPNHPLLKKFDCFIDGAGNEKVNAD